VAGREQQPEVAVDAEPAREPAATQQRRDDQRRGAEQVAEAERGERHEAEAPAGQHDADAQ
jgi:hypothetical protein